MSDHGLLYVATGEITFSESLLKTGSEPEPAESQAVSSLVWLFSNSLLNGNCGFCFLVLWGEKKQPHVENLTLTTSCPSTPPMTAQTGDISEKQ